MGNRVAEEKIALVACGLPQGEVRIMCAQPIPEILKFDIAVLIEIDAEALVACSPDGVAVREEEQREFWPRTGGDPLLHWSEKGCEYRHAKRRLRPPLFFVVGRGEALPEVAKLMDYHR